MRGERRERVCGQRGWCMRGRKGGGEREREGVGDRGSEGGAKPSPPPQHPCIFTSAEHPIEG